jgi:GT2 family glycosyltransferase
MTADGPRVSVIVPTCNRGERLERLISALAEQDLTEPFEVVVVDDASHDDTLVRLGRLKAAQPFTLVPVPSAHNTGPAGARNRGWTVARGELIAFIDDDCVPAREWLRHLVDGLASADVVIGRTRPPEDQLHLVGPFSTLLDLDHNRSFSSCNIAYQRSVLEKLGGFNQVAFKWPNGEDTDLGLRALKAGFRDHFVSGALVWHDVGPSEFGTYLRRVRRLVFTVGGQSRFNRLGQRSRPPASTTSPRCPAADRGGRLAVPLAV